MRGRLGGVDADERTDLLGAADDLLDRVVGAMMFETSVKETIFVFSVMISSMLDRSSRPSSVMPNHFSFAPVRCESNCQGTMLEWCSISVVTISVSWSTR